MPGLRGHDRDRERSRGRQPAAATRALSVAFCGAVGTCLGAPYALWLAAASRSGSDVEAVRTAGYFGLRRVAFGWCLPAKPGAGAPLVEGVRRRERRWCPVLSRCPRPRPPRRRRHGSVGRHDYTGRREGAAKPARPSFAPTARPLQMRGVSIACVASITKGLLCFSA